MNVEQEANNAEQEAYNTILRWCRSRVRGQGHPVMRVRPDGTCVVLDLSRSTKKPGGFDWETEPVLLASGADWTAVLVGLDGVMKGGAK